MKNHLSHVEICAAIAAGEPVVVTVGTVGACARICIPRLLGAGRDGYARFVYEDLLAPSGVFEDLSGTAHRYKFRIPDVEVQVWKPSAAERSRVSHLLGRTRTKIPETLLEDIETVFCEA